MKFKVGDKVRVKQDLKSGSHYGGLYFNDEMEKYCGKEFEIITLNEETKIYYLSLDGTNEASSLNTYWGFSGEMLKVLKPKKATAKDEKFQELLDLLVKQNEKQTNWMEQFSDSFDKISNNVNNVSDSINKKSFYDDAIIEKVMEKIEKIPVDKFKESIESGAENYIRKTYGALPTKIEILKDNTVVKQTDGLFHYKFEDILKIIDKGVPLMLTGPAGAGKNHTLEQVAEALGLDFYFTNAVTQEFKLTGFIDANGIYQETQFYKAFKDGGLFFLDEVDASCPEALVILNSAIANGYFDFPNGKVQANENFRVACAGNTYGTGADMIYVGRNTLDGATLDRFVTIEFNYDENIEKQLAYDDELYNFITNLRKVIQEASLRYIVSMRATINSTKLLEIDIPKKDVLKTAIIKNMQEDDLNVIIKKIDTSNEWARLLKAMVK